MKQSGIDWIGEIPDDWKTRQIRYLFSLRDERNYKPLSEVNLISIYTDKGVLQHSDIEQTTGNKAQNADGYKHVYKNDLVVNIILCWMGALGISDFDGVTSPAYDVYAPKDLNTILPKYYHYLFRTPQFNGKCYTEGRGIMQMRWRTYSSEFKSIKVPLPPKATQQRIAEYLDSKCAQIDSIIEESKKSIEEYKTWKQSVIFEAVTGKNINCKKKDSGIEWIGEIPAEWEVRKIRTIANIIRGGSPRPIDEFMTNSESGFNWIKIGDTVKGSKYITSTKTKIIKEGLSKTRIVNPGDLILTNSMSFGEPYILKINGCIHDGWVAFSQIIKSVNKEFLYYFLRSSFCNTQFQLQVDGGVVQNLNIDKIKSTTLFLPPLPEQESIAKMLDSKCAQIDSLIAEKESLIADLTEYKKSLIFEVVTGKRSV